MITEIAILRVRKEESIAFEKSFEDAKSIMHP